MNDERFVAHMDDAADAVARVEGRTGARIVFDGAVIVAMLDVLRRNGKNGGTLIK